MKALTLILILAICAQPLQAGFCAMDMDQGQSQGMAHDMDTENSDGHGCCDPEESDSGDACESGMHCGFCTAGVSLLPEALRVSPVWHHGYAFELSDGRVLPSHASPPYRPPIS